MTITKEELVRLIEQKKRSFNNIDLSGMDLCGINFSKADLSGANFSESILARAYFPRATLARTNFQGADLSGASFYKANLMNANMREANLFDAYFQGATNIPEHVCEMTLRCPARGEFVAYKKCRHGEIIKLLIPADAARSSATTNKCRASHVLVLEGQGESAWDSGVLYTPRKVVRCHHWDPDRWKECSGGIHFFMLREEAEAFIP